MKCPACELPITRPFIDGVFRGKPGSKMDGTPIRVHAACFELRFPATPAAPRAVEPQQDIVGVERTDLGWVAHCRECDDDVAIKHERDDAELAAARHIWRRHDGAAA